MRGACCLPGNSVGPHRAISEAGRPAHRVGFEVDDLAAVRERLFALGIRDVRAESMGWGDALELRDTDGHRVVIYSFPMAGDRGAA
jgi:hypothetical protein